VKKILVLFAMLALLPIGALADDDDDDATSGFGLAGLLSGKNKKDLPPIKLSAGAPLADAPLTLKSGTYYEIEIIADGTQELALVGPEFSEQDSADALQKYLRICPEAEGKAFAALAEQEGCLRFEPNTTSDPQASLF